jgi:hypothetical protein
MESEQIFLKSTPFAQSRPSHPSFHFKHFHGFETSDSHV